jgi:hypothetical protein
MNPMKRTKIVLAGVVAAAALVPSTADASELITRNASDVRLQVNGSGQALLSYTAQGVRKNVLVWGAINAHHPARGRGQVAFKIDYSGGYGTFKRPVWKSFANACTPYDGPKLEWLVTACKAPDGSYWAVQAWQRMLPNYGLTASADRAGWELRLSHWNGPIAQLTIHTNWAYGRFHHLFGSFTYLGRPVHGFKTTRTGVPLDDFGRNLYVDTLDSRYGSGWKRENSFLTHVGTGKFCYGFYPHGARPTGMGARYRATVIGPGVTPDIYWEGASPGSYSKAFDRTQHEVQRAFYRGGDPSCKPV